MNRSEPIPNAHPSLHLPDFSPNPSPALVHIFDAELSLSCHAPCPDNSDPNFHPPLASQNLLGNLIYPGSFSQSLNCPASRPNEHSQGSRGAFTPVSNKFEPTPKDEQDDFHWNFRQKEQILLQNSVNFQNNPFRKDFRKVVNCGALKTEGYELSFKGVARNDSSESPSVGIKAKSESGNLDAPPNQDSAGQTLKWIARAAFTALQKRRKMETDQLMEELKNNSELGKIKRRLYDAINVMISLNLIRKEKSTLFMSSKGAQKRLDQDIDQVDPENQDYENKLRRVSAKKQHLQLLMARLAYLKKLKQRNMQLPQDKGVRVYFPLMIFNDQGFELKISGINSGEEAGQTVELVLSKEGQSVSDLDSLAYLFVLSRSDLQGAQMKTIQKV